MRWNVHVVNTDIPLTVLLQKHWSHFHNKMNVISQEIVRNTGVTFTIPTPDPDDTNEMECVYGVNH